MEYGREWATILARLMYYKDIAPFRVAYPRNITRLIIPNERELSSARGFLYKA